MALFNCKLEEIHTCIEEDIILFIRLPIIKSDTFATLTVSDNYYINKTPFLKIVDYDGTAKLFLNAVLKKDFDDARRYISKKFIDTIDLAEINDIVATKKICSYMQKIKFEKDNDNFKTTSVILSENGKNSIMHVHLIQETSQAGKWKIFGIEKE